MFKKALFSLYILFAFSITAQSQRRYKDFIYNDVRIDENLSYAMNLVGKDAKPYLFDLYQGRDDKALRRPLIIWMHGGGFKFGSKDAKGIKLWCKTFAQRGYVCAGINYSLSKKNPIFHFGELQKASYFAVQDLKMAVAYFRKNADKYNIDPDKIILAGNSAGGIISLLAAYSNNAELSKAVGLTVEDDAMVNSRERLKVAAVVNYWGGIYDLDWLKNAKVPIVDVVGSEDGILAPDHKDAPLYGAIAVNREADLLHIPNKLKVFEGYSHELQKHFNPIFPVGEGTEDRWMQAGQFTADFLYEVVVR